MNEATLDEAQICETASLLWLEDGQPQGCDEDHWARAIEILKKPATEAKPVRNAAAKSRATSAVSKKTSKPKAGTIAKVAAKE